MYFRLIDVCSHKILLKNTWTAGHKKHCSIYSGLPKLNLFQNWIFWSFFMAKGLKNLWKQKKYWQKLRFKGIVSLYWGDLQTTVNDTRGCLREFSSSFFRAIFLNYTLNARLKKIAFSPIFFAKNEFSIFVMIWRFAKRDLE